MKLKKLYIINCLLKSKMDCIKIIFDKNKKKKFLLYFRKKFKKKSSVTNYF